MFGKIKKYNISNNFNLKTRLKVKLEILKYLIIKLFKTNIYKLEEEKFIKINFNFFSNFL